MSKFRFKLQSVLDVKEKMENQQKIEYGLANARLTEERDILEQLLIQKAGYDRKSRELMKGKLNLLEVKSCRKAIDTMKSRIPTQMMAVHRAERQVEEERRKLNEIMVERKTYEKLREKQFDEYKQELLHEEGKEVDELVSYTYGQKRNEDT